MRPTDEAKPTANSTANSMGDGTEPFGHTSARPKNRKDTIA